MQHDLGAVWLPQAEGGTVPGVCPNPEPHPSGLDTSWDLYLFTHGSGLRPWAPGHSVCVSLSSTPPLEQMQDAKCKACFTLTRKIGGSALRVEHALGGITPLPPRGGLTPWFVCPSAVRREVVLPGSQGLGHLGSVLHRHCGWHCSVLCLVQRCRQCPAQIPSSSC